MTDQHDRERAVAAAMAEHWPFDGGFTVEHVTFPDPVVEVHYDGGSFLVDGRGGFWNMEEHILDNLPYRFFQDIKPQGDDG